MGNNAPVITNFKLEQKKIVKKMLEELEKYSGDDTDEITIIVYLRHLILSKISKWSYSRLQLFYTVLMRVINHLGDILKLKIDKEYYEKKGMFY